MLQRRKFLAGLTGIICAPAIVRASSLMAVRSFDEIRPIPIGPLSPDFEEMIRIRERIEREFYGEFGLMRGVLFA